jgi:hypothetical protein
MQGDDRYQDMISTLNGIENTSNFGELSPSRVLSQEKKIPLFLFDKTKLKEYAIYCAVFFVWSLILVIIFHPSVIDVDGKISIKKYFTISFFVFATLLLTFFVTNYLYRRFIKKMTF